MFYTHAALDRADHLRRDTKALAALRHHPDTRLIPIWQGTALVTGDVAGGDVAMASLPHDAEVPARDEVFLGLVDGAACFAINACRLNETERAHLAANARTRTGETLTAEFADLRMVGPHLPADEGALLTYARGLVYWQEHTNHCSRCGAVLESEQGGHVKRCTATACNHPTFPRTDPAVIMLVTHHPKHGEPQCLLGRSPAWPNEVYSTLAGFVEPGESLEQAVQREVFEEAGVHTTDVRYIASQPWPFPRSVMLGFEATATSTGINLDPNELADAQWFTATELAGFGNWGDGSSNKQLPRPDSISRFLINRWVAQFSNA